MIANTENVNATETPLIEREFRVGKRTVTMQVPRLECGELSVMNVMWEPDVPRRLSDRECRQYRRGREAVFAEVSKLLGINIAIVDL
jgi:hypothetical protein